MKLSLALATLPLALTALAPAARADEPAAPATDAQPAAHYPPPSVRGKLVAGGLAITGLSYVAVLGSAIAWPEVRNDDAAKSLKEGIPGSDSLKIPFAGPWLALAKTECAKSNLPASSGCDAGVYIRDVLFVIDGIAQIAGLGLLVEAIAMKTEANPSTKTSLTLGLPGGVKVRPVPVATPRFTGLSFVGSF